jgi:PAS domain-containing protein
VAPRRDGLPQKELIIDGKHNHADWVTALRRRAEEQARQEAARPLEDPALVTPEDARSMLHELRVREIELAMQHEELLRMQSELEALRQSDSVHRLLADNSVDMISRHAADGTVLYVSPACKLISGYTAEELVGKPAECLVFPEDVEKVWSVIEAAQASNDSWYLAQLPQFSRKMIFPGSILS